jgi:hypothetical protein
MNMMPLRTCSEDHHLFHQAAAAAAIATVLFDEEIGLLT